jgi:hypothetical protein
MTFSGSTLNAEVYFESPGRDFRSFTFELAICGLRDRRSGLSDLTSKLPGRFSISFLMEMRSFKFIFKRPCTRASLLQLFLIRLN